MLTVDFVGPRWTPAARQHVTRELEASAARRGFTLCPLQRAAREVAAVAAIALIRHAAPPTRALTITIRDTVTQKRVRRAIDVARLPPDAQPLAIAIATDELLRASWLEVSLRRARAAAPRAAAAAAASPKRPPPPAAVARVVRADIAHAADDLLRRPSAQRTNIGAALAFDGFSAGERHLGADLYFTYWLAPLVGLELSVGARRGLAVSSRNGSMQATALGGAFGVLLRPLRWQHAAIAAGASLRVVGVVFRGAAVDASAALASSDTGLAVSARARAGGLFTVGRLQLRVFGGLGAPIAGVAGTDDGERVSAVSGLEIFGQLGVGFAL